MPRSSPSGHDNLAGRRWGLQSQNMDWLENSSLVRGAGELWREATTAKFLEAIHDGTLPQEAIDRWLVEDYHFADALTSFQAVTLARTPRPLRAPLLRGLHALDAEMEWFESLARARKLNLSVAPHRIGRAYADFLLRVAYSEPYPVLLATLFGVEASYLAAWSRLEPQGPYAELIERWSSEPFVDYVKSLLALSAAHPHEANQAFFNQVLEHERDFWTMSWGG